MNHSAAESERPPLELTTPVQGLVLRELEPGDAQTFVDWALSNREHLTEFGGEETLPPHTVEDVIAWVCTLRERDFKPGIWLDGALIGHVTVSHLSYARGRTEELLAQSPDGFALGYGLALARTGRGYATEACRALMDYARREQGAVDFYSGTFPDNLKSQAVLERLGFERYKATEEYVSYRLLERVAL